MIELLYHSVHDFIVLSFDEMPKTTEQVCHVVETFLLDVIVGGLENASHQTMCQSVCHQLTHFFWDDSDERLQPDRINVAKFIFAFENELAQFVADFSNLNKGKNNTLGN